MKRFLLVSLLLSLSSGCVVIPHRGKVFGPGGKAGSVDLGFLAVGSTSREEIRQRLQMADLGLPGDTLFWGRWRREWDVYWLAAGGGDTSATAGSGKQQVWRRRNVLVEFGPDGKVSAWQAIGDSDLLHSLAAAKPDPGVASPEELTLVSGEGETISFRNGSVWFSGLSIGNPRFECPFASISGLTITQESTESRIALRLDTSIRAGFRRKATRQFTLKPLEVLELVRFVDARGLSRLFQ